MTNQVTQQKEFNPLLIDAGFSLDVPSILVNAKQMCVALQREVQVKFHSFHSVINGGKKDQLYFEHNAGIVTAPININYKMTYNYGGYAEIVSCWVDCDDKDFKLELWDKTKDANGEIRPTTATITNS